MATTFGLGGYNVELTISDGNAKFHFVDPEDANNTADTTVAQKDFPEGVTAADARQVADIAYGLVGKTLNDKRDARVKKEAADELNKRIDDEATLREASNEFLTNSQEQGDTTGVITTGDDPEESQDSSKKK